MNIMDKLADVYRNLLNGNLSVITHDLVETINTFATYYINPDYTWNNDDKLIAKYILDISDVLYNNTSADVLPLDDGVYDQLLIMFKKHEDDFIYYTPGAPSINFAEKATNELDEPKVMCCCVPDEEMDKFMYTREIMNQNTPSISKLITMCTIDKGPLKKKFTNSTHNYPELVGTLDKCKFVLNEEAKANDVFDKPSITIFERDFIHKHIDAGIITQDEIFEMVGELKYDGVSVEATVLGDTIISAFSRGDTAENLAADLTPLLGGYKFLNAKDVPKDKPFGIKFEAIITKFDLDRMSNIRGKSYKNCRNAIIGLLGSSDAYKYIDFITLMPLSTSLDMDRLAEIEFINRYYSAGQYNRYAVFRGNYMQILYQVNQFTKSAELIREVMPYLYDGVVVSYTDRDKIAKLGRVNSVNKYSMAIKFNPKKVRTTFLGYEYTVGKTGTITPMAKFKPCEFMGTIHTKQTVHSYKRFKELALRKYDDIDVEYRNEVICYVTKPDTERNRNNNYPLEEFPKVCPVCGHDLKMSDSADSIYCPNIQCGGRIIGRMTDMISRLGFKDFSEETIKQLHLESFVQLVSLYPDQTLILGPTNQLKFEQCVDRVLYEPINDYVIMTALGFANIGAETWKSILHEYNIKELLQMHNNGTLIESLVKINSIGEITAKTIDSCIDIYREDVNYVSHMKNIVDSKGIEKGPKVAITGFRDPEFIELLNNNGFDASDSYGVSKKISYLIAADPYATSSKIVKANKFGIPIMTMEEFINFAKIKL